MNLFLWNQFAFCNILYSSLSSYLHIFLTQFLLAWWLTCILAIWIISPWEFWKCFYYVPYFSIFIQVMFLFTKKCHLWNCADKYSIHATTAKIDKVEKSSMLILGLFSFGLTKVTWSSTHLNAVPCASVAIWKTVRPFVSMA